MMRKRIIRTLGLAVLCRGCAPLVPDQGKSMPRDENDCWYPDCQAIVASLPSSYSSPTRMLIVFQRQMMLASDFPQRTSQIFELA